MVALAEWDGGKVLGEITTRAPTVMDYLMVKAEWFSWMVMFLRGNFDKVGRTVKENTFALMEAFSKENMQTAKDLEKGTAICSLRVVLFM